MLKAETSDVPSLLPSEACKRLTLAKGQAVFLTDDPTYGLFLIQCGQVRLVRHAIDGSSITLHVAGTGETFAEASLFAERYHCDAITEKPTKLLHFSKDRILDMLQSDSRQARRWVERLSQQVQGLRAQTALLGLKTAQQRVLGYLHMRVRDSRKLSIDRPWNVIASELGLTHEAVYRALARLEQQGVIKRDRKASMIELRADRAL